MPHGKWMEESECIQGNREVSGKVTVVSARVAVETKKWIVQAIFWESS